MKKFCLVFRIIFSVQLNPFYKSIVKIICKAINMSIEKIPYFYSSLIIK